MSRCEECWNEATRRHAGGQGEGDSVTQVYYRLIDADWCYDSPTRREARERAALVATPTDAPSNRSE
jgi:hypothetical protein